MARSGSTDLQAILKGGAGGGFPFSTEFSLGSLIDFWLRAGDDESPICSALGRLVGAEIQKAPELAGTITDPAVLERHGDLVDLLMSAEFPPALWDIAHGAAMIPFQLRGFYATPAMRREVVDDDRRLKGRINLDEALVSGIRPGYAYAPLLKPPYRLEGEL